MLDVVAAINAQDDYTRTRNYWKYLKTKLRKQGSELVSETNQLKLRAADGKRYLTDVLDYDGVMKPYYYEQDYDLTDKDFNLIFSIGDFIRMRIFQQMENRPKQQLHHRIF